jgi:hypothetical protein
MWAATDVFDHLKTDPTLAGWGKDRMIRGVEWPAAHLRARTQWRISMSYRLFIALLLCALAGSLHAQVVSQNPNAIISIVGDDSIVLTSPYMVLPTNFAVQVVDAKGQPIPGLTVQFKSSLLCDIMFDGNCAVELAETPGSFENGEFMQFVTTDSAGVATASVFVGGGVPGNYVVEASLSDSFSSKDASVLQGLGDPQADFQVVQSFPDSTIAIQPALTGSWYDKYLSGQGFNIEVIANNQVVVFFYTFDPAGNNVWLIGLGTQENVDQDSGFATIPLYTTMNGKFPPFYDPSTITKAPWGTLSLHFSDCNSGEAAWNVDGGAAQGYTNGQMPIIRITSIPGLTCS